MQGEKCSKKTIGLCGNSGGCRLIFLSRVLGIGLLSRHAMLYIVSDVVRGCMLNVAP